MSLVTLKAQRRDVERWVRELPEHAPASFVDLCDWLSRWEWRGCP